LVALVKEGKIYTILKDHLGSTRVVVDEAGTVIAAFDYLPFGDLMGTAYGNPEFISYRYTGQEFDAELGLYNYRARFYDPRLGRFYATDPKGQFASPYLYAGNNPIIYVDPDGQLAWWGWLGIALAVVAVGVVTIATAGAAAPVLAALTGEIVKDTIIASTLVAAGEGLVTIGASVAVVGTALSGCSSGGTVSVPTSSGGASGSGSVPTSSSGGFGSGSGGGGDERRPPKRDSYTGHYAPITRARKRKILRRYPGINPDNIVHGRRLRRPPDRYGFSRQPRFVPIEGNRWGLDPGTYYRASVRIQYNLTSADDIAEADQWLINQGLPPRDPNTEVWHHFHDYDPNTNTGTLYLMLRIYHWLGHSGGRWQYDRGW
jgi:RHS repeat-associated protein